MRKGETEGREETQKREHRRRKIRREQEGGREGRTVVILCSTVSKHRDSFPATCAEDRTALG